MLTVTDQKNLLARFTGLNQTEIDSYGIMLINTGRTQILTTINSYITEEPFIASTIASQQDYALPVRAFKVDNVSVLISSVRYSPECITDPKQWHQLTAVNSPTGTVPMFYYVDKNKISFYPTPSSSTGVIRAIVTCRESDLTQEDATGGTLAVTNGSATVTGTGTTFTSTNVGWKVLLPDYNWYEVATVASTTSLTLTKLYEGPTASGATYRMGQVSIIPDEGQILPVYFAAMTHFRTQEKTAKADGFMKLYLGSRTPEGQYADGVMALKAQYGNRVEGGFRSGAESNLPLKNINDYPTIT